jgi:hypothetical protein
MEWFEEILAYLASDTHAPIEVHQVNRVLNNGISKDVFSGMSKGERL